MEDSRLDPRSGQRHNPCSPPMLELRPPLPPPTLTWVYGTALHVSWATSCGSSGRDTVGATSCP